MRLSIALALCSFAAASGAAADPAGESSQLAAGPAWSLGLTGGTSASAFSVAPALGEDAAVGSYLWSSERSALSLEVYEAADLVIDRTTPELGLLGISARRFAKPDHPLIGAPGKIDFQRIAAGLAVTYDGQQLATGIGAEATVAYLVHGAHGISVHLGGYFFDSSDLSKHTLIMLSVGYVFSPVEARPYYPFEDTTPIPGHACRDASAYRYALAEAHNLAATACQDEHAPACVRVRSRITLLHAGLNNCLLGIDVGPPEIPGAP